MSRNRKCKTSLALMCLLLGSAALAQAPAPTPPMPPAGMRPPAHALPAKAQTADLQLKFKNAPIDVLLQDYSEKTGRTLLQQPNIPKVNITLEGRTSLTLDEYLQAMDSVLAMNGVSLLKVGDKFLKVVAINTARTEEMGIREEGAPQPSETSELISQMIQLQYVTTTEAQAAITPLMRPTYPKPIAFDRINSILVTDSAANINRIMQIMKYIDQPTEAKEEPNIIEIHYASAADIKKKLEDVIADQLKDAEKSTVPRMRDSGSPGVVTAPTVPGVIRAQPSAVTKTQPQSNDLTSQAERGILIGKVKIIADERTNILIIITRHENMGFFEKIITVLDVPTAPDVTVKIIRLQYANAEKTAATLNSLIGGKSPDKPKDATTAKPGAPGEQGKSAALNDYVQKLENPTAPVIAGSLKSKVGELSAANIKILSDDRTNALLLMASKADMAALEEMIKDMDIMLSQVLIEGVVFRISLQDTTTRGVDVVQRALLAYQNNTSGKKAEVAFAGVAGGSTLRSSMKDPMTLTSLNGLSTTVGNLTYYFTFFNLNLDAIVQLISANNKVQVMSSPQILTIDNKAASINVTQERAFNDGLVQTGTSVSGAPTWIDNIKRQKIGTKVEVTPHINEKKFVVMEIKQTLEELGTPQQVTGPNGAETWDTIDSAEVSANVAVRSGETIVLGGLVENTKENVQNKIPILGDIPILGNFFKSVQDTANRTETVIFITPYVLNTPEDIESEATRIRNAANVEGMWPKGWSRSTLADDKKHDYAAKRQERALAEQADKESKLAEKEAAAKAKAVAAAEKQPAANKKSGPADKGQQAVQETPAADASAKKDVPVSVKPAGQIDPAMEQFIERQEKRWGSELKDVDQNAVKEPARQPE